MQDFTIEDGASFAFTDDDGKRRFFVIERDNFAESPREWANIAKLYSFRQRTLIIDGHGYDGPVSLLEDLCRAHRPDLDPSALSPSGLIDAIKDKVFVTNIYALDHSGIQVRAGDENPFNDPWDSGFVGLAIVKKDRLQELGNSRGDWRKNAMEAIQSELRTFQMYLDGDVYGYVEYATEGGHWGTSCEEVDSCWGFYGYSLLENGMLEHWGVEPQALEDGRCVSCEHEAHTRVIHSFYPARCSPIDEVIAEINETVPSDRQIQSLAEDTPPLL